MKLAPSQWKGSARQLIEEVLQPHFIPAQRVEAWQAFLERRMKEADPLYMAGTPSPDLRSRWGGEKIHVTRHDARVTFGDRSPAVAVYTSLLERDLTSGENMAALYLHLPHHGFDLDRFTRWATITNNVASAGWLVAHIFPGTTASANWENLGREELRRMTIRNLHALNMFVFPNLNKAGALFADDPRFHSLVAEAYAKHYGSLWDSYLALTGDQVSNLPAPVDFEIDLAARAKSPEGGKAELTAKIEPREAKDLKLVTVNEAQGYQSRLLEPAALSRGFLDIKLEYKEKAGGSRVVGYFRLNITDLYEKKFLARDAKGVRLLVHRTEDGSFAVGPKKTGPLAPLPN